jgi:hypothetical protein
MVEQVDRKEKKRKEKKRKEKKRKEKKRNRKEKKQKRNTLIYSPALGSCIISLQTRFFSFKSARPNVSRERKKAVARMLCS